MTEQAISYVKRMIRDYGNDNKPGLQRIADRLATGNSEEWSLEECSYISAALTTFLES